MQSRFPVESETNFRRCLHRIVGFVVLLTSSALALLVFDWIIAP